MTHARIMERLVLAFAGPVAAPLSAQGPGSDRMPVEIAADGAPVPGDTWMVALHFSPSTSEWHGYWSNPGDAGLGMQLDWQLPDGWEAGDALYPLPHRLVIGGLMNHVYEGEYAVLVPVSVPSGADVGKAGPITVTASYLACTDTICVPLCRLAIRHRAATRQPCAFRIHGDASACWNSHSVRNSARRSACFSRHGRTG